MYLNATYKNTWNRKQNKVCVTLDSELYRRMPVLTYAISGNVVGGVGGFGELERDLTTGVFVCPTICHTLVGRLKTNDRRITWVLPSGCPGTLDFLYQLS